jgi:hypothetical protein
VATSGTECDAAVNVTPIQPVDGDGAPDEITEAIEDARAVWELPGGEEILDPLRLNAKLKQLTQGFYYKWEWDGNDGPDREWLAARRRFNARVRAFTKRAGTGRDTYARVLELLESGEIKEWDEYTEWMEIKDRASRTRRTRWISDYLLEDATERAGPDPTIVWYKHRAVGERLAEYIPTAQAGEDVPDGDVIGLSMDSHATGLNLQRFRRSIVLCSPANGGLWHQLIGRIHRPGFDGDVVEVQWYNHDDVLRTAYSNALESARWMAEGQGVEHKLLLDGGNKIS